MVSAAYAAALSRLSGAGANIMEIPLAEPNDVAGLNRRGGFVTAEAYAWHRR